MWENEEQNLHVATSLVLLSFCTNAVLGLHLGLRVLFGCFPVAPSPTPEISVEHDTTRRRKGRAKRVWGVLANANKPPSTSVHFMIKNVSSLHAKC